MNKDPLSRKNHVYIVVQLSPENLLSSQTHVYVMPILEMLVSKIGDYVFLNISAIFFKPTDEFSDLPLRVAEITKEQRLRRESQYQENHSSLVVTNGGGKQNSDAIGRF